MNLNLDYSGFETNLFRKYIHGVPYEESQYIFKFENNYGASVVKNSLGSYGHKQDLWELAVLEFNNDKYRITYDTPITEDVVGWLSDDGVKDILKRVKQMEQKENRND